MCNAYHVILTAENPKTLKKKSVESSIHVFSIGPKLPFTPMKHFSLLLKYHKMCILTIFCELLYHEFFRHSKSMLYNLHRKFTERVVVIISLTFLTTINLL